MNAQLHFRAPTMVSTETMTVTPEMATEWLKHNTGNRPLMPAHIAQLASDMTSGRWVLNGETIKFAPNGRLLDGQNRLMAIKKANMPIVCVVAYNVPESAFSTIDVGRRRTNAQIGAIAGFKNVHNLAAAARAILMAQSGSNRAQSPAEMLSTIDAHPLLEHYVSEIAKGDVRSVAGSGFAGVLTLMAEKYGREVADSFLHQVRTGENLSRGSPAYELREKFIRQSHGSRLLPLARTALTIKACSAFANGRTLGVLRWKSNERFPEL